mgnify:FL=1
MAATPGGYSISKVGSACAGSGKPINVGDDIVTALVEDEESMHRVDFLADAWDEGARPDANLTFHGFWRREAPAHDAPRAGLVDAESMIDLFDQLASATEQRGLVLRYVLTLILVRKKALVYEGSRDGAMLVRRRGDALPVERGGEGPDFIEVADPGMDDDAIAEAIDQVGQVLEGDDA